MGSLAGKRVLCIVPRFFGYETDIQNELKIQGAHVDLLIDRPFESSLLKALAKLRPEALFSYTNKLYLSEIQKFHAKFYDYIFVVNGQTISNGFIRKLRTLFPQAEFILYMWDAIANRQHIVKNLPLFDRSYTFDPLDSSKYGMQLRPLFYNRSIQKDPNAHCKYDVSFVGTAHTDRYHIVSKVNASLPSEKNTFWYLYLQAPWVFYYYKYTNPTMRGAQITDFKFSSLNKKTIGDVFRESSVVLDIEHPLQNGLTMRTFETLGSAKKLITTNTSIINYDFYNSNNIFVIDRQNPKIDEKFLSSPYVDLPESIYQKYSIEGWVNNIFNDI
ncbi:MAG: hypothetical protein KGM99_01335 [Burkholderiales bacterium]|nr:hypothetical protein [Burkholderiales bacterium]